MTLTTYFDHIARATADELDWIAKAFWRRVGRDIAEAEAPAIDAAIRSRRAELSAQRIQRTAKPISAFVEPVQAQDRDDDEPATSTHTRPSTIFPKRKHIASPDREASRMRRRRWGLVRAMPDHIAERYTEAPRSVGGVIASQCAAFGRCVLPIARIAAMAGVSRTTVWNYMSKAIERGEIEVIERRTRGGLSNTNIIRIKSKEWLDWILKGAKLLKNRAFKIINCLSPTKENKKEREQHTGFPQADNTGDHSFSRDGPQLCREALSGAPS